MSTEDAMTSHPAEMTSLSLSVFERYPGNMLYRRFIPEIIDINLIMLAVWMTLGLTGNAVSAMIWLQRRMRDRNSSAIYVAALSINCIVFLVSYLLNWLKIPSRKTDGRLFVGMCELIDGLFYTPQYLTQLVILAFTVDRYIVVCHPLRRRSYCRPSRAVKVTLALTGVSITLAVVKVIISEYDAYCREVDTVTSMVWLWFSESLFNLLLPIITIVLNILVIRGLPSFRRSRGQELRMTAGCGDSRDHKGRKTTTTLMLLSISFFYVVTTLPITIIHVLHLAFPMGRDFPMTDDDVLADDTWRDFFTYHRVNFVVSCLSVSHYACNFFIFIPTGRHFRQAFWDLVRCRRPGRSFDEPTLPPPWKQRQRAAVTAAQ